MSKSDYLELELLDHVLGNSAYSAPATVYVGLSTADPTDSGSGIAEPSNGYARVAVTNNSTNWPAAASGAKANGTEIQFPEASGSWGTVTHWFISDASSSGNMLYHGSLSVSRSVIAGDAPRFDVGELDITEA